MPRFYCATALSVGTNLELPAGAARHVQVLRMQPQMPLVLFDGQGGQYDAVIEQMGRSHVTVHILAHHNIERETATAVHLVLGVPANERMDWLVEKATELGVASIQPLMTQRTVLRLAGDRALKKQAHWQAITHAACEQSGRNRIPLIHPIMSFANYAMQAQKNLTASKDLRLVLSLNQGCQTLSQVLLSQSVTAVSVLSGPEGGLTLEEEHQALAMAYQPVSLGARVLRAETAALAALTRITA